MKTICLLLLPFLITSCASTGFFREVPTSISSQGLGAKLRYLILETPEDWDTTFNPLDEPGLPEFTDAQKVARRHREHFRLIADDKARDIGLDLKEDWAINNP